MKDNWLSLVNREQAFRDCHQEWPIPETFDSILFALTETIEFLEAFYLRQNENYIRTNDKESDPVQELTQVVMMLATSIIQESKGPSLPNLSQDQALILLHVLTIIDNLTESLHTLIHESLRASKPDSIPVATSLIQSFQSCMWIAHKLDVSLWEELLQEHYRIVEKLKEDSK